MQLTWLHTEEDTVSGSTRNVYLYATSAKDCFDWYHAIRHSKLYWLTVLTYFPLEATHCTLHVVYITSVLFRSVACPVVYCTVLMYCTLQKCIGSRDAVMIYWLVAMTGAGGLPDVARERAGREADARLQHRGLDSKGRAARTRRLEEALVHTRSQDTHVLRRPPRTLAHSIPNPLLILIVLIITMLCPELRSTSTRNSSHAITHSLHFTVLLCAFVFIISSVRRDRE